MKSILITFLILCCIYCSYAQRGCPTVADYEQMQKEDPERYKRFMELEKFRDKQSLTLRSPNQRLINNNGTIVIPVVVHVLHQGEAEGSGRNISFAQIQSQIDVLNEDFRRLNPDRTNTPGAFAGVASDYGIEFRLACLDPNGNPTNGVIRRATNRANYTFSTNENTVGIKMTGLSGDDPWPTNTYLNIWVANFSDGTLGYATFPADFATRPNLDGVVVHTTAMGRVGNVVAPFDRGRTATHEIGHWMDLRHIWGDANCGNDQVGDTPPQTTATQGCPGFPRPSACVGNGANGDMFMNYMDYTDDPCMNMFTNGQRARSRVIFAPGGPRAGFINSIFSIQQPAQPIRCRETVSLVNPMCLGPVTWSVLSGPASITAGPGNNQATVQSTGVGQATIRATSGNFVSDVIIDVNQNAAPIFAQAQQVNCTELNAFVSNSNFITYDWSAGGDISFNGSPTATTNSGFISANGTYGNIYVTATNACGTSSSTSAYYSQTYPPSLSGIQPYIPYPEASCYEPEAFYYFQATSYGPNPTSYQWGYRLVGGSDVIVSGTSYIQGFIFNNPGNYEIFVRPQNDCVTGNEVTKAITVSYSCFGGYSRSASSNAKSDYLVYPNPASSQIKVIVKPTHGSVKLLDAPVSIERIVIYNKMGIPQKTFKFSRNTKQVSIDVSNIPSDVYILEVHDGIHVSRQSILIKR